MIRLAASLSKSDEHDPHDNFYPSITVLLACHNEEAVIERRLENLFGCEYPADKLQMLVVLDGCTDATESKVRQQSKDKPVDLLVLAEGGGKSSAQNAAMPFARGEIVVLTDADTLFEKNFLCKMVSPFADAEIGGATGALMFRGEGEILSQGQGWHWNQELKMRDAESRLGILVVGSGQCLAFRRSLFVEMPAEVGDDCIIPLDIVSAGYRLAHVPDAIAYDVQEADPRREFATRVRMTLRNWVGTWMRSRLLNPLHYPGYAFSLWSHKILRWLSPVFLAIAMVSALIVSNNAGWNWLAWSLGIFWGAGIVGWLGSKLGITIPLMSTVYSFLLVNAAFFVGIFKALMGIRIRAYRAGLSGERDVR